MWYPAIITMPHEDDLENVCFQCPKLALIHRGWRAHRSRVIVAGWAPPGMFFPFGQALTSHDSGPTAREARAEVSDTERRTMQRLQLLESRIVLLERRSIEMRSGDSAEETDGDELDAAWDDALVGTTYELV